MPRQRSSGRKTDYGWIGACSSVVGVDLPVNTGSLGSSGINLTAPSTLTRTRGKLLIQLDAGANDERVVIAVGLIVVQSSAFVSGLAAVPKPHTDAEADWFWHQYVILSSLAESAVTGDSTFLAERVEIDSKAMRKIKPNESIIGVAEVCSVVDQTGLWDWMFGIRCLFGS